MAMIGIVSADTYYIYVYDGTDTYDGWVSNTTDTTFAAKYAGNGAAYDSSPSATTYDVVLTASTTSNQYSLLRRWVATFNTSIVQDTDNIDSVELDLTGTSTAKVNGLGNSSINVVSMTSAPTTIGANDYEKKGTTVYGTMAYNDWTSSAWNNITFNSAGKAAVDKTGSTYVMAVMGWDVSGDTTGLTWASATSSGYRFRDTTYTGTANDPVLKVVTSASGSAPVSSFTCTKNFVRIPNSVTCTDSSTNTPTSWSWNMGDGSAAITTQNVTYQYTKRGSWGVTLNATNAQGSNVTAATNVKVVGYENYY
jgi:hypothetical protein